jgi:hypothetical protein
MAVTIDPTNMTDEQILAAVRADAARAAQESAAKLRAERLEAHPIRVQTLALEKCRWAGERAMDAVDAAIVAHRAACPHPREFLEHHPRATAECLLCGAHDVTTKEQP